MKRIVMIFKSWLSYSDSDDLVVVDLTTKLIQSMSPREWSRLKDKQNFMIVK